MGNNTNIFPNQVQEFPMPDWSLEKQTRIALKIKAQLDFQKKIANFAVKTAEDEKTGTAFLPF